MKKEYIQPQSECQLLEVQNVLAGVSIEDRTITETGGNVPERKYIGHLIYS